MVRTKADTAGVKASGAKLPRKSFPNTPTRSSSFDADIKNKTSSGGNSYHPRETPEWQKPITSFFISPSIPAISSKDSGSSKEISDSTSTTSDSAK